jgi:benzoyl-CoA reductase/2-hydroxyglutaryl-CoA dehydratase subunit BcrC/BadD/HgdB
MSILAELKDELLYEYQNEFYNERGMGAKYRLVLAGTNLFAKHLKDPSNIKEIIALFKNEGLCSAVESTEDDFSVYLTVHDCAFCNVRDKFMDTGRQPMCCPLTNAIMKAIELQTGLSPEMLPVERDGCICKVGVGKMGTADVVDEKGVF